jgi:hypothetical protein
MTHSHSPLPLYLLRLESRSLHKFNWLVLLPSCLHICNKWHWRYKCMNRESIRPCTSEVGSKTLSLCIHFATVKTDVPFHCAEHYNPRGHQFSFRNNTTTESLFLANFLRRNIFFSLWKTSSTTRCISVPPPPLHRHSSSSVSLELSSYHDNYIH